MLYKRYRIGPVGFLNITYKRISEENITKESVCEKCSIGIEKCSSAVIAYSTIGNINFGSVCTLVEGAIIGTNKKYGKIKYIPWKFN